MPDTSGGIISYKIDGVQKATKTRYSTWDTSGIRKIALGHNASVNQPGYFDDVTFTSYTPSTPTIAAATANSTSEITWTWVNNASYHFGFDVADNGGTVKSPAWDASGWLTRTATSWKETSLSANASYTRKVRAWNGTLASAYSGTASKYTLQNSATAPTFSNVTTTGMRVTTTGPVNLTSGSSGVIFHDGTADRAKVTLLHDDVTGLSPNTAYTFKAKALNGDGVATGYSATASKYTLIQTPTGVSFGTITPTSIDAAPTGTLNNLTAGSSGVRVSNTTAGNDSGWKQNTSGYTSSSLTANTEYTFVARARNGDGTETGDSASAKAWTLSVAPGVGSVTPSLANPCANETLDWTATGGFGAGKVQKYKYVFTQNASHSWDGTEAEWASGTLPTTPTAPGTWYLHVRGYNGASVANGEYRYEVTAAPPSVGGTATAAR